MIICDYLVPLLCASWFACHSFLSIAASIFFLYLACPSFTNQHLYSLTSVTELPRAFLFKSFHWHEPSSLFGRPLQVQLSAGADLALGDCLHPHHQSMVLLVIHVPSSTWPCQSFFILPILEVSQQYYTIGWSAFSLTSVLKSFSCGYCSFINPPLYSAH